MHDRSRLDPEVRRKLEKKRLVFTVTTGRSGTDYLRELARRMPGVYAVHEPWPHFAVLMRRAQSEPGLARRFWVEDKLPRIATRKKRVYFETSHLFAKGFFEPLVELGFVPDLVCLSRDARATAMSMWQLDTIPGRTVRGDVWYLRPDDPGALPLPGWDRLHDYQLCYWYCLETARRQTEYSAIVRARGGRSLEIGLSELNQPMGITRLCDFLAGTRLAPRTFLYALEARVRAPNTKSSKKDPRRGELDFEKLEREVRELSLVSPRKPTIA
ncbi:MAG: hypothetical protein HYV07_21840 [Deltaproteobacteria bacterium]|nr:hypothetical protein [Deltaproteobacteria bacterium]